MEKVAVSACLLGHNCKYNGSNNKNENILNYLKDKLVFPICPEVMGGLSTPRIPAELSNNKVINKNNEDVTIYFEKGSFEALKVIIDNNIKIVIVKEKSPSCGKNYIYDGTFSSKLIKGSGYFTKKLNDLNITILTENDFK